MKHTVGHLTVSIEPIYDEQGNEYLSVDISSGDSHLVDRLQLHTNDMEIVTQALTKYFEKGGV